MRQVLSLSLLLSLYNSSEAVPERLSADEGQVSQGALLDQNQRHGDQLRINSDSSGELQNEEQCWISPLDADLRCAVWRDFRLGYRQIGVGISEDGGQSWQDRLLEPDLQLFDWQSDPDLAWDGLGNLYLTTLDFTPEAENTLTLYLSNDGGATFTYMGNTGVQHEDNYFEDKQMLCCDRSGTDSDGVLHMTWSRFDYTGPNTTNYILHSRSLDQGITWSLPQQLSAESVQWSNPAVGAQGEVYVGWVDFQTSSIRFALSTDAGASFGNEQLLREVTRVNDNLNGDIRSYTYPAWEVDLSDGQHHGRLHLCYMNQLNEDADVWYSYSDDAGASWSEDLRLNTDEFDNGRDQFHPWLTVDDTGRVHVIWYDRRHDPDNYLVDFYYRSSSDGGSSWSDEIRVTDAPFDPRAGTDRAGLLGEYLGLATQAGFVQTVFTDTRLGDQDAWSAAFRVPEAPVVTPCGPPCGVVDDVPAFVEALENGDIGLSLSDWDSDTLWVTWFAGWEFWSDTLVITPGETVNCHPSIADLNGHSGFLTSMYYTVSDGEHLVNPQGVDCLWELDLTSISKQPERPFDLGLQRWPNPFNPTLHIEARHRGLETAWLRVHDLRGRLVQEWKLGGGQTSQVHWEAHVLPAGLYLLELEQGDQVLREKALLMK